MKAIWITIGTITLSFSAHALEVKNVDYNSPPTWTAGVMNYSFRQPLPFQTWQQSAREEAQILNLYPGYTEVEREKERDGMVKQELEEQKIFVSRTTFLIERPVDQMNLDRLVSVEAIKKIDQSFSHEQISANQLIKRPDGSPLNPNPVRPWCSAPGSLCLNSRWDLPKEYHGLAGLALKKMGFVDGNGKPTKDFFQISQSEVLIVPSADIAKFAPLVRGNPRGVLEHNIFYVNQAMRWGRNIVILQEGPNQTTRVTVYSVVSVASEYYDAAVLPGKPPKTLGFFLLNVRGKCSDGPMAGMSKLSECAAEGVSEFLKNL